MAANTSPIYGLTPKIGRAIWTSSLTANTKSDGAGTIATDMVLLFTAGADGSFLHRVRFSPCASVAATATTATVVRVYISTVTSGATARTDTVQVAEIALPAQTADQTTTAINYVELALGFALDANQTVLFSMHHAAAANTSWGALLFAANY